mgnify:FL=1
MLICFTIAYFKSLRTKIVTSDEDLYSMRSGSVRGLRNSRIAPIIMISNEDDIKDNKVKDDEVKDDEVRLSLPV